jgi:hypothetical protein
MQLAFDADQRDLFDAFEQFFSRESPPSVARAAEPLGFDAALWRKLEAMEVWGSGATVADLAVVAEVAGRWIAPVPFVEHAVASRVLGLTDGQRIATIALRPAVADVWRLVPAGAVADIVLGLHPGTGGSGGGWVITTNDAPPGIAPRNHACAPIADRSAENPRSLLPGGRVLDFDRVLAEWKVLTAATMVGISGRALEMAVAYVQQREQFGVPIGTFQAVQHGLADLPGMIDGARLLVHEAAGALDASAAGGDDPDRNDYGDPVTLASMAFVFASDVAAHATDRALHFHGGYGFAEEYDIQLYYRRARGWSLVNGDPAAECVALADRLWST